jgi:hypothetical protein
MRFFNSVVVTTAPRAAILVRLLVGAVFLSEGIQKFLFSQTLGVGHFAKIGILFPEITALFVGEIEIVGGILLICWYAFDGSNPLLPIILRINHLRICPRVLDAVLFPFGSIVA